METNHIVLPESGSLPNQNETWKKKTKTERFWDKSFVVL